MKFHPPLAAREVEAVFKTSFHKVRALTDGAGGQGIVFHAECVKTGAPVALKVFYPGATAERNEREVHALRRINSRHLVKIHSSGAQKIRGDECLFLATQFIEGELLSKVLARNPLSVRDCAKVGMDISAAIEAMWSERIVHRDIKPNNIMWTPAGDAVLFDMGVARHVSMASLTTIGHTYGTQGYLSPEHARAMRQLSCKADMFALGITIQEALLGRHPIGNIQHLLVNGGPATANLKPGLPKEFTQLVDSMVTREPQRRPAPVQATAAFSRLI